MGPRVLVTGGTGFLGRKLGIELRSSCEVVLTGRNNKVNADAARETRCTVLPLDVTNVESLRDIVAEVRPDCVIHAAATKFVDLSERQPMECLDVNVLGSRNVARVAIDKGVEYVIGISTDKAAPPAHNTYGLSKSLMERVFCSMNGKTRTKFACVRFGNIAWSTNSVLPEWKRMHEMTGVVGTTGPHMRRFFFTVDEAAALVLTAMDEIERIQGRVLSRRMKASQIEDLLTVYVELKGGRWEEIEGRPGDGVDETLIGESELPFTEEVGYDGLPHYLTAFNHRVEHPIPEGLSSANADRLSREEMVALIEWQR